MESHNTKGTSFYEEYKVSKYFYPSELCGISLQAIFNLVADTLTYVSYCSKACVIRPLKIDKTNILMTNSSLMKVESIAESSPWSILPYF